MVKKYTRYSINLVYIYVPYRTDICTTSDFAQVRKLKLVWRYRYEPRPAVRTQNVRMQVQTSSWPQDMPANNVERERKATLYVHHTSTLVHTSVLLVEGHPGTHVPGEHDSERTRLPCAPYNVKRLSFPTRAQHRMSCGREEVAETRNTSSRQR